MDLGLEGKVAFVTGASQGIGLETARMLAQEGVDVVISARREDVLADAAADIEATTGRSVRTLCMDVTRLEEVDALPLYFERETGGRIDLLVNNAGTGMYTPFLDVTEADLLYAMSINFFAPFRICQRLVPLMIARGGGSIVNVSGATGNRVVNPPMLSSCSGPSKAAEIRFSKILASELAPHRIRVNVVVPGLVYTPERYARWEKKFADHPLTPEEADVERRSWLANQGAQDTRWGTPEEQASLIVFTLSDRASYVNGAMLVADNAMDKG